VAVFSLAGVYTEGVGLHIGEDYQLKETGVQRRVRGAAGAHLIASVHFVPAVRLGVRLLLHPCDGGASRGGAAVEVQSAGVAVSRAQHWIKDAIRHRLQMLWLI
jgi:hypothetical protein